MLQKVSSERLDPTGNFPTKLFHTKQAYKRTHNSTFILRRRRTAVPFKPFTPIQYNKFIVFTALRSQSLKKRFAHFCQYQFIKINYSHTITNINGSYKTLYTIYEYLFFTSKILLTTLSLITLVSNKKTDRFLKTESNHEEMSMSNIDISSHLHSSLSLSSSSSFSSPTSCPVRLQQVTIPVKRNKKQAMHKLTCKLYAIKTILPLFFLLLLSLSHPPQHFTFPLLFYPNSTPLIYFLPFTSSHIITQCFLIHSLLCKHISNLLFCVHPFYFTYFPFVHLFSYRR
jgi:hypothetical protein